MSAQLHPRMTGNGPIHVPRLLPKVTLTLENVSCVF